MTTIDIETEARTGYLYVRCRGMFALAALLRAFDEALRTAAAQGFKAVLVDLRELEGKPPTTLERYELGVNRAKLQSDLATRIRVAVVGKEPMIDPQRFGETVARNRGALGKVFIDIDEALAWIEKGGDG